MWLCPFCPLLGNTYRRASIKFIKAVTNTYLSQPQYIDLPFGLQVVWRGDHHPVVHFRMQDLLAKAQALTKITRRGHPSAEQAL